MPCVEEQLKQISLIYSILKIFGWNGEAVFHYGGCPDCLSYQANAFRMDSATWAVKAAIKNCHLSVACVCFSPVEAYVSQWMYSVPPDKEASTSHAYTAWVAGRERRGAAWKLVTASGKRHKYVNLLTEEWCNALPTSVGGEHSTRFVNSLSAGHDNWCTVGGDGGCRVGEVRAGTTFPMPDHKGFKLQ